MTVGDAPVTLSQLAPTPVPRLGLVTFVVWAAGEKVHGCVGRSLRDPEACVSRVTAVSGEGAALTTRRDLALGEMRGFALVSLTGIASVMLRCYRSRRRRRRDETLPIGGSGKQNVYMYANDDLIF